MNADDNMGVSTAQFEFYQKLFEKAANACYPTPKGSSGRGIVICGGGRKYFTCAWVCINMLRRLGCALPIELWYLGKAEMDEKMSALVADMNVQTVDGHKIREAHPVRTLRGWELKPYSIIHSSFEEVLFLDADNVPVVNPEFLFDTAQYKETGAIFWPDFRNLARDNPIWDICGINYRNEAEFESGQMLINKSRCRKALNLAMHLNEYSDFYYNLTYGDKETYHMAWRRLKQPYSMPDHPIHAIFGTMCQHDFGGRRIFQHRNMDKWNVDGGNRHVEGFLFEKACFGYLEVLKNVWSRSLSQT